MWNFFFFKKKKKEYVEAVISTGAYVYVSCFIKVAVSATWLLICNIKKALLRGDRMETQFGVWGYVFIYVHHLRGEIYL
jgi:hypothetical protein